MTTGVGPAPQLTLKAILLSIVLTVILASANAYVRSEEHTSELQSPYHISYAVFCLKTKNIT
jgi:hypothetical protein